MAIFLIRDIAALIGEFDVVEHAAEAGEMDLLDDFAAKSVEF